MLISLFLVMVLLMVEGEAVSCGHHTASECKDCTQGHGASWCNGECRWCTDTCVLKTRSCPVTNQVSCGHHKAITCSACTQGNGASWCNGDCKWCNGGCQLKTKSCAVNGNWNGWSGFGRCSKTCGQGTKRRTRSCNNPSPAHGGLNCPGWNFEDATCKDRECPLVAVGQVYRFASKNYPRSMLRHRSFEIWLDESIVNPGSYVADSSFTVVAGLAGKGISLRSVNFPDRYVRHRRGLFYLDRSDTSDLFKNDASFMPVKGLAASGNYVSFQSVNYPTNYLRHMRGRARLMGYANDALFKNDATFLPILVPTKQYDFKGSRAMLYSEEEITT